MLLDLSQREKPQPTILAIANGNQSLTDVPQTILQTS
jgi:hypothetical protein